MTVVPSNATVITTVPDKYYNIERRLGRVSQYGTTAGPCMEGHFLEYANCGSGIQ
jgi:hypothetical protein